MRLGSFLSAHCNCWLFEWNVPGPLGSQMVLVIWILNSISADKIQKLQGEQKANYFILLFPKATLNKDFSRRNLSLQNISQAISAQPTVQTETMMTQLIILLWTCSLTKENMVPLLKYFWVFFYTNVHARGFYKGGAFVALFPSCSLLNYYYHNSRG